MWDRPGGLSYAGGIAKKCFEANLQFDDAVMGFRFQVAHVSVKTVYADGAFGREGEGLFETVNHCIGVDTADAGVGRAELFPGNAEFLVGASLADLAEALRLDGGAL